MTKPGKALLKIVGFMLLESSMDMRIPVDINKAEVTDFMENVMGLWNGKFHLTGLLMTFLINSLRTPVWRIPEDTDA